MAFLVPVAAAVGIGLGVAGSIKGAEAQRKAATQERVAADFEATQLEDRAKDTVAAASFRADRIQKRAQQILSTQRAMLAANGGDTTDVTAQAITDDTIRKASLDSLLEMANAESSAQKDKLRAKMTRETGKRMSDVRRDQATGTLLSGFGDALSGGASWAEKYGRKSTVSR